MNLEQISDLLQKGVVTSELLQKFDEAYVYGAAPAMSWLLDCITILSKVLTSGENLSVFDRTEGKNVLLKSEECFKNWVSFNYPEISSILNDG
jgi:hypothetical protein